MDPKSTATVGSAAVATVEDDPTSTAGVWQKEGDLNVVRKGDQQFKTNAMNYYKAFWSKTVTPRRGQQKSCRLGSTQHRKSRKGR